MDDDIRQLVDDLFETMRAAKGVGLAANQVGVAQRVAVVDVGEESGPPLVLINPRIVEVGMKPRRAEEGCLSIPDVYGDVERPVLDLLEAWTGMGRRIASTVSGYKARAVQHEIDHLDGILFLDRLSAVKRGLLMAKWKKLRKGKTGHIKEVVPEPAGEAVVRVVFFGTPEFAVPSLGALLGEGFDVVAVVTQPDRPQGRSRSQSVASPVKQAALADEVPVLQPERPTGSGIHADAARPRTGRRRRRRLRPHSQARPAAHSAARDGEPASLPASRAARCGAGRMGHSAMACEATGVSIMQMDAGMDSGPVLHHIPERAARGHHRR